MTTLMRGKMRVPVELSATVELTRGRTREVTKRIVLKEIFAGWSMREAIDHELKKPENRKIRRVLGDRYEWRMDLGD